MKFLILSLILFANVSAEAAPAALENLLKRASAYPCLPEVTRGEPFEWQPAFIFDLDETLVDSSPRMWRAYRDAIADFCPNAPASDRRLCDRLGSLRLRDLDERVNQYDPAELFGSLGLAFTPAAREIHERALEIYLTGQYIAEDTALPGAVEWIRRLRGLRSCPLIYFVSSRYEDAQGEATLKSLVRLGLMDADHGSMVILRRRGESSLEFKRNAFGQIRGRVEGAGHPVLGVFENEPENLNALREYFPDAVPFFIRGAFIKPEPLQGHPIQLRDYR